MLVKKDAQPHLPYDAHGYEQELRELYARRSAIDTLIRSLQMYSQLPQRPIESRRKLA